MVTTEIEQMLSDPKTSDVIEKANSAIQRGCIVHFKWTCLGCGKRAIADEPNSLHASWLHTDCGVETRTVDGDLGFLLIAGLATRDFKIGKVAEGGSV